MRTRLQNGPLCANGAVINTVSSSPVFVPSAVRSAVATAGAVATITFGRPVLPPDAIAFHAGEITPRSRTVPGCGSGRCPDARCGRPPSTDLSPPTTTDGSISSTSATSSAAASRSLSGTGTAPAFQTPTSTDTNSKPLGRTRQTKSPARTPR